MYIPHTTTNDTIKAVGEIITIFSDETTSRGARASIDMVDKTDFDLIKLGLRPNIDLVAHVPSDTTVSRSQKVVYQSENYEVLQIQDSKDDKSNVVSRTLLLVFHGSNEYDLRA